MAILSPTSDLLPAWHWMLQHCGAEQGEGAAAKRQREMLLPSQRRRGFESARIESKWN